LKTGPFKTAAAGLLALLGATQALAQAGDGAPALSPEYVYVTNRTTSEGFGSTVSAFERDPRTGKLAPVAGSPFPSGGFVPSDVVVDRKNYFAYVVNTHSATIGAFRIDPRTGALAPIPGSPFQIGFDVRHLLIHPKGQFAFLSDLDFEIHALRIDPSGVVRPVPGSPFPGGLLNLGMAIAPSGRFLYTANGWDEGGGTKGTILVHEIDQVTGALMQVGSPVPAGDLTFNVAIHPSGRYLYAVNRNSNDVSAWSIDEASGALTPIAGSPFAAGTAPQAVVIAPSGKLAFVSNRNSGDVSVYGIEGETGRLQPIPGSPFHAGEAAEDLVLDHSGRFLHVSHGDALDEISAFEVDTNGTLKRVLGSPFRSDARGAYGITTTSFNRRSRQQQ
jgi:6-phosphogluconolactonase